MWTGGSAPKIFWSPVNISGICSFRRFAIFVIDASQCNNMFVTVLHCSLVLQSCIAHLTPRTCLLCLYQIESITQLNRDRNILTESPSISPVYEVAAAQQRFVNALLRVHGLLSGCIMNDLGRHQGHQRAYKLRQGTQLYFSIVQRRACAENEMRRTNCRIILSNPTINPFTADPVKALHFAILV